jgi:HEAT repeat protein
LRPVPNEARQQDIGQNLRQLADPNEGVRLDAVTQLGRMRAFRAIDPVAATLAGDQSPAVREAAAHALGLIASPKALPALNRALQSDPDRDVRKAAQFAVEIIQSRKR